MALSDVAVLVACGMPLRVIQRLFDQSIVCIIPAQDFGIITLPSCWLMLGIEKGDLSQIALQVIRVGDFCISLFVADGLIGGIEVRLFHLLALRIVFPPQLDVGLVIVSWVSRGAKIAHFNRVPTVVMDQLDVRISFRRAYRVIPFIQTAVFNKTAAVIMRESVLGTAVDIPYRTLV